MTPGIWGALEFGNFWRSGSHVWLGLLTVVLILSVACGAGGTETTELTFEVGASPRLVVGAENGDVTVQTGPDGTITVHSVSTSTDNVELEVSADGDVVTATSLTNHSRNLFGDTAEGRVDFTITVPLNTAIEVGIANGAVNVDGVTGGGTVTAGNGVVVLRNVTGDFSGGAGSGDVSISDGSGSFRFTTGVGSITFAGDLTAVGTNEFETGTGDVSVMIAEDASIEVEATVTTGSITNDFDFANEALGPDGNAGHLTGTLGDGDAELVILVSVGSVDIGRRP